MSEVNLSLRYYDNGYLSLVLALPVFKIQIMLALLFDKKSKIMLVLSNNAKNYADTIYSSLFSICQNYKKKNSSGSEFIECSDHCHDKL